MKEFKLVKKSLSFLVFTLVLAFNAVAAGDNKTQFKKTPIKVVFLLPTEVENPFWSSVTHAMESAAQQLNIDLKVYSIEKDTNVDRYYHLLLAKLILKKHPHIDYFVTQIQLGKEKELLDLISQTRVKFLSITSGLMDSQLKITGKPREKYPQWLGELVTDDIYAGSQLMKSLIKAAEDKKLVNRGVAAISGGHFKSSVKQRSKGLKLALSHNSEYKLARIVYTNWQPELVVEKTQAIFNRFKNTGLVWCANDESIASNVINTLNSRPGYNKQKLVIGGIDWSNQGIDLLKKKQLDVSLGGHFLDGGIMMALIYDYHNGLDFYQQFGGTIKQKLINANDHLDKIAHLYQSNEHWKKLDFTLYSKLKHNKNKQWDLGYKRVFEEYKIRNLNQ